MKKILTLVFILFSITAFSQRVIVTDTLMAKRVKLRGVNMDSLSVDATFSAAANTKVASTAAIKAYIDNSITDSLTALSLSVLEDSIVVLYSNGVEVTRDTVHGTGGVGAASPIDTITSIAALAAYAGSSPVVYLQDHVKTYRGNSFTIAGGLLRRIPSGTVNHVTIYAGSGSIKWQREFDGTTYYPEWVNVGVTIGGVDIRSEAGRVRVAASTGGAGATIVFQKDKIYSGQDIYILKSEGQTWEGNGATLKAGDLIQTTLTSGYTAGGTVISVADTSDFRVGQNIVLRRGIGSTTHDATTSTITAVGASTITFTPAFSSNWGSGKFVTVVFDQVVMSTNDRNEGGIITNLVFDGNRSQQNATQSWLLNATFLGTSANSIKLERCHFKNARCENVISGTLKISNSTADSCGGSFAHFNASPANDNTRFGFVDQCRWTNMNLNNPDSAGHSEAVIILSSNCYNIAITNNIGTDGGDVTFIDDINYFNGSLVVSHNKMWSYGKILEATTEDSTIVEGDIEISNNEFHSCGDIAFLSTYGSPELDYRGGNIRRRIDIKNNNFINDKIVGGWVGNINIQNNTFEHRVGYYGFEGWTAFTGTDTRYDAYVTLQNFDRAIISGNSFEGTAAYNDTLDTAIKFILGYRYDDLVYGATDSSYHYPQSVLVEGNTISNSRYGIFTRHEEILNREKPVVNWFFTGNTITSRSDSIVGACLQVPPGAVAMNNNLTNISPHADYHALLVQGILDDGNDNFERLVGGEATYNTIMGQGSSIRIGSWTSVAVNMHYNALVMYNTYTGAYLDQTGGKSTALFNTKKDSTLLPFLTAPENPALHGFQENKEDY